MRTAAVLLLLFGVGANALAWIYVLLARRAYTVLLAVISVVSALFMYQCTAVGSTLSLHLSTEETAMSKSVVFAADAERIGEDCGICLQPYTAQDECRLLSCGHVYHDVCVRTWGRCPLKCTE